ncbi:glycosyltransferase family 2 protein [Thalassotalea fusca]
MSVNEPYLPLVSVYMPTKNRLELLKRAIDSVFAQSYPNIDLHIVDDGSTDGTYAYLLDLANENSNVHVYRNEQSLGACASRNIAIKSAKGEFVTGLDDDDLFLPHRISSLVEAYDDQFAFCCSSMWWDYGKKQRLIDASEKVIKLDEQLSYNEATSQVLVKRQRVLDVGGFDESFVACQDYDLWTRLMLSYGCSYRIANPSYIINDTGSSERMIGNPKSVQGYQQFYEKHHKHMSKANKANQRFMKIRRERKALTLSELIRQMSAGHVSAKLRYFLSSNIGWVRKLRQFYTKG